jgi:hypothetical protein
MYVSYKKANAQPGFPIHFYYGEAEQSGDKTGES